MQSLAYLSCEQMIDAEISNRARQFSEFWTELLRNHPRYALDYSWPSLSTVQLILHPLVRKDHLSQTDENVLLDASAYLCVMAYRCWTMFDPQLKVKAQLSKETPPAIELVAEGSELLPKSKKAKVSCTAVLRRLLKECPTPFPVFENIDVSIEPNRYLVSLFAMGLLTGLSPDVDSPWKDQKAEEVTVQLGTAEALMASSSAEFYKRVHPEKTFGANARLYKGGLIMPPAGTTEKFPGSRAALRLYRFLKADGADDEDIQACCSDLMQSPDRQFADAAYCVAAAMQDAAPSEKLCAVADALGKRRLLFKGAVAIVRKDRGVPHSLETLIKQNEIEKAELLVEIDRALGLAPLFSVPLQKTLEIETLPHLLYWNMPQEARAAIDSYGRLTALPAELILLGISLDSYLGDVRRMTEELQNREKNRALASIDDPILGALRDEMIATAALGAGDFSLAISYFEKAGEVTLLPARPRSEMHLLRAESLLLLGKQSDALNAFEESVKLFPLFQSQLRLLQLQADALTPEERERRAEKLSRLAPRSPEVFQFLIAEKARRFS